MAGLDTPSNGDAALTPGYSVGILLQEPELDESKTVLENVRDGVREIHDKIVRFNEISAAMSDPDADFDSLLAEMGTLQEAIDSADAWDLDSQLEQAMDALRCPTFRRFHYPPFWRREASCSAVQVASREARSSPPGRAHQPPRC
jgi:ATPase subunit of ABC transporter with duplicated ATPase domains